MLRRAQICDLVFESYWSAARSDVIASCGLSDCTSFSSLCNSLRTAS